ncbi:hypothetical protein Psch_02663 [Pelotomaculum schinkii]|uniref:Uncharacterized protein n=1 Tax=Pelotomaculum schinkii TaxID=78350 RepID=A0A4Y7RA14_9FIRM|nr:hypothetical protein [Pelotomaculum schinkii]TEB05622.1 hypothetical protein Psch_02663 [Pelotomaculum schinkii]
MFKNKTAITIFKERRIHPMKEHMSNALLRAKAALANPSGDQMTGWLIVVLVVVVVGAVFMTLYQGSITSIWNSIVDKITGLLS